MRQAKQYISDTRHAEVEKIAEELKTFGVDWSDAPADVQALAAPAVPTGQVDVKVETDRPNNEVTSRATRSTSSSPSPTTGTVLALYRLFGVTMSENPLFDNKQLVIGKLEPGKSRMVTVPAGWCEFKGHKVGSTAEIKQDAPRQCTIPQDALMRSDGVKVHFEEREGTRAGRHRASRDGQVARPAHLRVFVRGHRATGAATTTVASRRAKT